MKQLILETLRPIYYYLSKPNFKKLHQLKTKYINTPRFQETSIDILGNTLKVPDAPSIIWQYKDIFIDQIYKFKSKNIAPIILDVGANVGLSVIFFSRLYPNSKITAIEADQTVFKYLEYNLKTYEINNCSLINKAAWINNDGVTFSAEGGDGGSIYANENKSLIPSIKLADIISNHPMVDMLKIDIEGAEYDVILDCKDVLEKVHHLFIEYHSWKNKDQKLSEILAILEQNNFRYYISGVSNKHHPFICDDKSSMDLQINIFAINQRY